VRKPTRRSSCSTSHLSTYLGSSLPPPDSAAALVLADTSSCTAAAAAALAAADGARCRLLVRRLLTAGDVPGLLAACAALLAPPPWSAGRLGMGPEGCVEEPPCPRLAGRCGCGSARDIPSVSALQQQGAEAEQLRHAHLNCQGLCAWRCSSWTAAAAASCSSPPAGERAEQRGISCTPRCAQLAGRPQARVRRTLSRSCK
jgi:hypothetical protein